MYHLDEGPLVAAGLVVSVWSTVVQCFFNNL